MVDYEEPEFLPWDGRRVPMTFLAGYLGAGKTTLLNRVLALADRPLAVLVNDVGEINIDAALVKRRHGDTIELTDGCVCCSLSDGFAVAIDGLRARPEPPDHVVVELSGIAQPSRVVPWSRSAGFKLDGVVTLVDVDQFEARLDDPLTATTLTTQIADADLVVMTKLDLVDQATQERARTHLTAIASDTPVLVDDGTTPAAILDLGGRRPGGTADMPQPTLFDRHQTSTVPLPSPIDRNELEQLIDRLPPGTVRAKGIAHDPDGRQLLVQVVGTRRSITELPPAEQEPTTDLVVITVGAG